MICVCAAFADYNIFGIPDSAEIRGDIIDEWFTYPVSGLRTKSEEVRENRIGQKFQIRMEEGGDAFCVIVSPESELDVNMIGENGSELVRAKVYPKEAAGSWVLYRDSESGDPLRLEWLFAADSAVYLQFRPNGRKTLVDLLVFDSYLARSVPIGIPFERLYSAGFQDVYDWTRQTFPWNKVQVVPGQYEDPLLMVGVIRNNLDSIIFTDDTCYDERGRLKSIFTGGDAVLTDSEGNALTPDSRKHYLSGAGFLKWIVDGIVEPVTGRGTRVIDLVEPTVTYNPVGKTGVLSQEWNLTFTLDWCRNLSAAAYSARSTREVTFESGGLDVSENNFASDIVNGSLISALGYVEDTGYVTQYIKPLLYVLAVTEPSWFYLGAIRQNSSTNYDEFVFNNCAVLFPYFNSDGKFDCFVFEQGREISLEDFLAKYEGTYIHLSRVKATDSFFPYEKR